MDRDVRIRMVFTATKTKTALFLAILVLPFVPSYLGSEIQQIVSYYPSPYGSYSVMASNDVTIGGPGKVPMSLVPDDYKPAISSAAGISITGPNAPNNMDDVVEIVSDHPSGGIWFGSISGGVGTNVKSLCGTILPGQQCSSIAPSAEHSGGVLASNIIYITSYRNDTTVFHGEATVSNKAICCAFGS